jgi:hypothetical protein
VFFAKTAENRLELQVQDIIKERVQNHMAMILRIVPLNQDPDTISTWKTVLEADPEQERTICILTKADLALKDGKEAFKKRLRNISSGLKHRRCFIVHGSLSETQNELNELKIVTDCIHDLDLNHVAVGISAVNECIEEKMLQHIKETIPKLRSSLYGKYEKCSEELNKIGIRAKQSYEVALGYRDSMIDHIKRKSDSTKAKYRQMVEEFSSETNNIKLEQLGVDASTDFKSNPTKQSMPNDRIVLLAKEIKSLGDIGRGFVNSCFCGHEKALEMFVKQFSDIFDTVATAFIEELYDVFITDIFGPSIKKMANEFKLKVLNTTVEKAVREVVSEERQKALNDKNWEIYCCQRRFFTTNTHYLEDIAKKVHDKLMEDDSLEDLKSSFDSLSDIKAFMKVRRKMLADNIQMKFTVGLEDLPGKIKEKIDKVLFSEKTLASIKESPEVIAIRDFYTSRLEMLKSALDEMSYL